MLDSPRRPSIIQRAKDWVAVFLIPLVVVPMVAWMLLSIVQVQKDIIALRGELREVRAMMQTHLEQVVTERVANSMLHHLGPTHPCNNCHDSRRLTNPPHAASPNEKTEQQK